MTLPATRREAQMLGETRYQRSKPCKNGHLGAQYVNGGCCECRNVKREGERELAVQRTQAWRSRRYSVLVSELREKARSTGVECRISAIEIIRLYNRSDICSLTGNVIIRPGVKGEALRQAALRRKSLSDGWVAGNVEVVSMRATLGNGGISDARFA